MGLASRGHTAHRTNRNKRNRHHKMSEATDPLALGVDLNDVDAGRPVLPKAQYVMKVDNVEVVENKAGTGRNLIIDFATTQPTESTKGAHVNVGFRIRNYYPLQPSENNPDSDLWKQRLAWRLSKVSVASSTPTSSRSVKSLLILTSRPRRNTAIRTESRRSLLLTKTKYKDLGMS